MNKLVLGCEMPSTAHLCERLAPRWYIVWESCGTFMEACWWNNQCEQEVETGYVGQGPERSSSQNDLVGGQKFQKIILLPSLWCLLNEHLWRKVTHAYMTEMERQHLYISANWTKELTRPILNPVSGITSLQGSQNSSFLDPWTPCTSSVCLSVCLSSIYLSVWLFVFLFLYLSYFPLSSHILTCESIINFSLTPTLCGLSISILWVDRTRNWKSLAGAGQLWWSLSFRIPEKDSVIFKHPNILFSAGYQL